MFEIKIDIKKTKNKIHELDNEHVLKTKKKNIRW